MRGQDKEVNCPSLGFLCKIHGPYFQSGSDMVGWHKIKYRHSLALHLCLFSDCSESAIHPKPSVALLAADFHVQLIIFLLTSGCGLIT